MKSPARLEASIRNAVAEQHTERIPKILRQLVHDYAYAVHQPHARNGGLIGLAAAAIALGSSVSPYLSLIVPPVLACFSDQDARVRYYACESMYNIAKVAKGEILIYFNDVFDALCKLAADTELSVKNGAELLDRLVKDIVSESGATYASIVVDPAALQDETVVNDEEETGTSAAGQQTAFSLPRFIPLLTERINVMNPFTRTFLVSWITLLDSIPDLELVVYLPSFLGGLLKFLSDPNQDVHTTTKVALDRFLAEIKKIAAVKKGIAENRRSRELLRNASAESVAVESPTMSEKAEREDHDEDQKPSSPAQFESLPTDVEEKGATDGESSVTAAEGQQDDADEDEDDDEDELNDAGVDEHDFEGEWIPGQDVTIDYQKILDILLNFLAHSSSNANSSPQSHSSGSSEREIQTTTLRWIESFLNICPEDILVFTPRLLAQVLPALSSDVEKVQAAASRVNEKLTSLVMDLPAEPNHTSIDGGPVDQTAGSAGNAQSFGGMPAGAVTAPGGTKGVNGIDKPSSNIPLPPKPATLRSQTSPERIQSLSPAQDVPAPETPTTADSAEAAPNGDHSARTDLDYEAAVNALTKQFLHSHEATRVAALAWLIMLHRKSPRRILAIQDATFPALLKTLSDPAEAVVTRDLLLLSQISKSSDDSYFSSFMVNLLKLFSNDRRLLETRGNLIIRQLCLSLSAEKIYRTLADCLEREEYSEDIEFASIMVQMLNNNLITAPELQDLRKRLRNLDTREGQTFFTVLFRAWCVNAVATFSLCLLAQAYEQAYHLLQIFAELEMTVTMLIQIDKLVQLLESPVFTYLRMQLLEPERYPHLYKCLYGVLMLLPQSSAFAALKNRLNSVSAIGYLHIAPRGGAGGGVSGSTGSTSSAVSTFERQNRLKGREEGTIRWTELLEKFKATQEKLRRAQRRLLVGDEDEEEEERIEAARAEGKRGGEYVLATAVGSAGLNSGTGSSGAPRPVSAQSYHGQPSLQLGVAASQAGRDAKGKEAGGGQASGGKAKSGFSHLGRLAAAGRKKERKDK